MVDVVSKQKRSEMMAGIKGKDTKPELFIRQALHTRGFRYRLHNNKLPGKPDLVFSKFNAVIFIDGCFWHRHNCHLFKWPKTRKEFWRKKITDTVDRDRTNRKKLGVQGWRILTIRECALKGKTKLDPDEVAQSAEQWLKSDNVAAEIEGTH